MNVVRPSFYPAALAELAASLQWLAARAGAGLQALAGMDPHSSSVLTTGTARYGKLMLVSGIWIDAFFVLGCCAARQLLADRCKHAACLPHPPTHSTIQHPCRIAPPAACGRTRLADSLA